MKILRLGILWRLQNSILRYNEMVFRGQGSGYRTGIPEHSARTKLQETNMRRYFFAIALSLAACVTSGAIFVFSLLRQFALVEVAASLVTAAQVFFLSSAIADLLEKEKRPRHGRNTLVVLFTFFLLAFYSFTQYSR